MLRRCSDEFGGASLPQYDLGTARLGILLTIVRFLEVCGFICKLLKEVDMRDELWHVTRALRSHCCGIATLKARRDRFFIKSQPDRVLGIPHHSYRVREVFK
jgi:hypothetical protein